MRMDEKLSWKDQRKKESLKRQRHRKKQSSRWLIRASDISRGRGPAKFRYFREIPQKYFQIKSSEISCFLAKIPPPPKKFPVKSADFSKNLPLKILRNLTFSAKIPWNRPIFREFWLFSRKNPAKSADFSANLPLKILRNFAFFSAKYQKPWLI